MPREKRSRKQRPLLSALRWAIGGAVMAATWYYGAWKGGTMLWIALPGGIVMMVAKIGRAHV